MWLESGTNLIHLTSLYSKKRRSPSEEEDIRTSRRA